MICNIPNSYMELYLNFIWFVFEFFGFTYTVKNGVLFNFVSFYGTKYEVAMTFYGNYTNGFYGLFRQWICISNNWSEVGILLWQVLMILENFFWGGLR